MEKIKISNFRKIKETWEFDLAPITFITGKNNSGKSSVLKALMVFSDYTNSSNHFELVFSGENMRSHKIENYSNCINWKNNAKSNVTFEFIKDKYTFFLEFSPNYIKNASFFQNGLLETLSVTNNRDNTKIELKRISKESYELNFNNRFLAYSKESEQDRKLLEAKESIKKEIEKTQLKIKKELGIDLAVPVASAALLSVLSLTPFGLLGTAGLTITKLISKNKLSELDQKKKITLRTNLEKLTSDLKTIEKKLNKKNEKEVNLDNDLIFSPSFNLAGLFLNNQKITDIFKNILIPYFKYSKKDFGNIDVRDETIKLVDFSNEFEDIFQFKVEHLSPNRYSQSRLILNEGTSDDISNIAKGQIVRGIKKDSDADNFIKKWMSKFDIGEDYEITPVQGQASIISVFEKDHKKPINLADKGFGAGQIFTILLKIAVYIDNRKINLKKNLYFPASPYLEQILIIEEPEANLHPALQSKLTELFLDAYSRFGIRFIIETHSEYIIRKSQLIFSKSKESKYFAVYYFDDKEPYQLNYNEDGSFDKNFGEGFLDVVDDIALEMFLENNTKV